MAKKNIKPSEAKQKALKLRQGAFEAVVRNLTTAAIQGRLICSVDNTYDGSESLIKLGAQIITYWQGLITLEQLHTEASAIWVGRLDDVFEFCTPSPLLADYKKHKGPDGKIQFTLPFVPHPKATRPIEQGGYSLEL